MRRWLSPLARFFDRQIEEIGSDRALRAYGIALAFLHVVTFFWWMDQRVIAFLHAGAEPICWPLFPECHRLRVLPPLGLAWLLLAYAGGAVGAGALFLSGRHVREAYWSLLGLNLVKVAIMLLDFRLRMNQHYMAFVVSAAFLFVPAKRDTLRVLVTLFYVWAGTLKLNWEWISGAGLYRPLWLFTGVGVIAACVYVIVLELVVSWGLLARRGWVFWVALAQVVNFHVFSWPVVGFFYPLLMFAILSIFLLCRLIPGPAGPGGGSRWANGALVALVRGRARPATYAMAAAFSLLQLTPYVFPGDSALTGEGRLYALHMFDARVACAGYAVLHDADGAATYRDLKLNTDTRIACDPVVFYNRARTLCRQRGPGATTVFRDLDLFLWARRTTDPDLKRVIAIEGFCGREVRYNPLWHNPWILTD